MSIKLTPPAAPAAEVDGETMTEPETVTELTADEPALAPRRWSLLPRWRSAATPAVAGDGARCAAETVFELEDVLVLLR